MQAQVLCRVGILKKTGSGFHFKGTVSQDFLYPVFFTYQLLLVLPVLEMSQGRFDL